MILPYWCPINSYSGNMYTVFNSVQCLFCAQCKNCPLINPETSTIPEYKSRNVLYPSEYVWSDPQPITIQYLLFLIWFLHSKAWVQPVSLRTESSEMTFCKICLWQKPNKQNKRFSLWRVSIGRIYVHFCSNFRIWYLYNVWYMYVHYRCTDNLHWIYWGGGGGGVLLACGIK
jgi:hypothetical protein